MLSGLRTCAADQRALARLHAAGEPDGRDRRGPAAAAVVSDQPPALRASASWCSSASRSIPSSSFPPEYPYTSGTTKLLRDNFAELYARSVGNARASASTISSSISARTTARCFRISRRRPPRSRHRADRRRQDRQPAAASRRCSAISRPEAAREVRREHGPARVVTAANCFAHIEDVHAIVDGIRRDARRPTACSSPNRTTSSGCSTRCSTTPSITSTCATIRSTAWRNLLQMHGLEVFHARPIPTHGGSIRVYAARRGVQPVQRQRRQDAGERTARRGDAGAAQELPRRGGAVQAAAVRA